MDSGLLALGGIFGSFGLIGLYLRWLARAPRVLAAKGSPSTWRFKSKAGLRKVGAELADVTKAHVAGLIKVEAKPPTTAAVVCTPPGPVRLRVDVVENGFPGTPMVLVLAREGPWVQIELRGSGGQFYPGQRAKARHCALVVQTLQAGLAAMSTPELSQRTGEGPWESLSES